MRTRTQPPAKNQRGQRSCSTMPLYNCYIGCQLRIREHEWTNCAPDASATEHEAEIGGWWIPDGLESIPANARWFCFQFIKAQLPCWFSSPGSSSLQPCIAAALQRFEALAQLVLLVLRCDELPRRGSFVLRFAQLTDNQSVCRCRMCCKLLGSFCVCWGYHSLAVTWLVWEMC